MPVKWILYIFNELCDYLSQRKEKIKLTDIWDHKQMTSSVYVITGTRWVPSIEVVRLLGKYQS